MVDIQDCIASFYCQLYSIDLNIKDCGFTVVETGMNGHSSPPTMKNCEGMRGIRNRLSIGRGAEFPGN